MLSWAISPLGGCLWSHSKCVCCLLRSRLGRVLDRIGSDLHHIDICRRRAAGQHSRNVRQPVRPWHVAADPAGNVFFVDQNTVLRLDATTGVLTLVAGNGTTGLQRRQRPGHQRPVVRSPRRRRGLRRQPLHRRHGNNRIRKVSNGVITTVAGNGTCRLQRRQRPGHQRPVGRSRGVAVDSAGNLYIADTVTTASARSRTG